MSETGVEHVGAAVTGDAPTAGETVTDAAASPAKKTAAKKTASARKADTGSSKGLHLAAERTARVDNYPERPYKEAMTAEQKQHLSDVGLL